MRHRGKGLLVAGLLRIHRRLRGIWLLIPRLLRIARLLIRCLLGSVGLRIPGLLIPWLLRIRLLRRCVRLLIPRLRRIAGRLLIRCLLGSVGLRIPGLLRVALLGIRLLRGIHLLLRRLSIGAVALRLRHVFHHDGTEPQHIHLPRAHHILRHVLPIADHPVDRLIILNVVIPIGTENKTMQPRQITFIHQRYITRSLSTDSHSLSLLQIQGTLHRGTSAVCNSQS